MSGAWRGLTRPLSLWTEEVAGKSGRIEASCAVRRGLGRQFKKPDLKRIARTETAGKRGLGWGGTTGSKLSFAWTSAAFAAGWATGYRPEQLVSG